MGNPALKLAQPPSGNLLFVDPDELLIEMIESGLSLSRPKWEIIAARHPAEAIEVLSTHAELDAIVTEVVFDRSAELGRVFIHEVAQRWPEIPLFAMSTLDRDSTGALDTAEFITKPPDIDFLVGRIDRAIRRRKESQVRGIALATFLQILEIEQKSCTVVVSHGGRVGEVSFRSGRLHQARAGALEGKEALFMLLSMEEPSLRIVDRCDAGPAIDATLSSLLMEWSIRIDHSRRDGASPFEETE